MSMENRITRIERAIQPKKCRECGGPLTATSKVRANVIWRIYGEPEPHAKPQYCQTCGRQLVFVVEWRNNG